MSERRTAFRFLAAGLFLVASAFFAPVGALATDRLAGEISKPALALSAAPDPKSPTGVAIPPDLAAAAAELARILPPALRNELVAAPEEEHARLRPELARWIKGNWGLYQSSALALWFENLGVLDPDDMAGMVLLGLWRRLHEAPLDIAPMLERYGMRLVAADSLPAVELAAGKKKETAYRFEGSGFVADLAPGTRVRVKQSAARPGFDLTYFFGATGEKQLLAVYAGPHPGFPSGVPERTRIRKGTFAGYYAEFAEWKRDGRAWREIKVEMPGASPAWLHLWYRGLDAGAKKEAERIISRFRPVKGAA